MNDFDSILLIVEYGYRQSSNYDKLILFKNQYILLW